MTEKIKCNSKEWCYFQCSPNSSFCAYKGDCDDKARTNSNHIETVQAITSPIKPKPPIDMGPKGG